MNLEGMQAGRLPLALAGLALALLAPLAWLQYSWIDRLARAETSRLQAHLQAASDGFQRDLNQQIGQVAAALTVRGRPGMNQEELSAALRTNLSEGPAAELVSGVFAVIHQPEGQLALYTLGPKSAFGPAKWPEELRGVRPAVEAVMWGDEAPAAGSPLRVIDYVILLPHGPMVTRLARGVPMGMPMGPRMMGSRGGPPPWAMGGPMGGGRECWLVVLNQDRLRSHLFPELKQRWFPSGGEIDYQVEVEQKAGMPWELKVSHRGRGLEQAVEDARTRNLFLSFGVLLVLALSVVASGVAVQRASTLAQARMEFAAGVSHELRTPLSVIVSAGDNLAAGSVAAPEQVRKYGTVIRDEGRRLTRMVEHVLGFARLARGEGNLHFVPVAVEPMVQRALEMCGPEIAASGVWVEVQVPAGTPPVLGDEASLVQCTRNLVENALTHGGAGGWVKVSAASRNGKIDISVEDRGPGIEADEHQRIFEPFARGRRAMAEQRRGSGLGLALVKRLAEAHGGRVQAERAGAQGGAKFVLSLPPAREGS